MPGGARLSQVQTPEIPPMQKALKRERLRARKCTGARHAAAWCNLLSSRLYCRLRSFTESTLRFVGCNHRWGISPRPEDWYFVGRDYTAVLFAVSIRNPKKFARGFELRTCSMLVAFSRSSNADWAGWINWAGRAEWTNRANWIDQSNRAPESVKRFRLTTRTSLRHYAGLSIQR